ncbi:MAG: MOSC N-terminal beta barrel domain-containing protein [Nitrolancea sp.]
MTLGSVHSLWRYPVKSMGGESLDSAMLSERGLHGDRIFALVDRETVKVASAKHPRLWGRLLDCTAALHSTDPLVVQIMGADGRTRLSSEPDVDQALSRIIGRDVTLASVPLEGAETERDYPTVEGLPVSGMFFSAPIAGGAPSGTFFDFAPVHLVTSATLGRLQSLASSAEIDSRRFRPNLVIDTADSVDGFVENDWVGTTIAIGDDVRLRVTDPTPRCVVPTLPQPGLARDTGLLRLIAQHNRPPIPTLGGALWPSIGVYAVVEQGGTIQRDDLVRIITG